MAKRNRSGTTAERFVDAAVELIEERGGSQDVNLREIARRVGCAHTNAYNYFSDFDDLMWAAFRRVLRIYGDAMTCDLESTLGPRDWLRRLLSNLASFPQEHPGLYRFIGSDPINQGIPRDILATVTVMKQWMFDTFAACAPDVDERIARDACNIVYAYLDGETFNLINRRMVPGEDISGRMVKNAERLFALLTGAGDDAGAFAPAEYPDPPFVDGQK